MLIKQSVVLNKSFWHVIVLIGTFNLSFAGLFVCCTVTLFYFYSFLSMPMLCFLHISIVTCIQGICNCVCF